MTDTLLIVDDVNVLSTLPSLVLSPVSLLVDNIESKPSIESFALTGFNTDLTVDDVSVQPSIGALALDVSLGVNDLSVASSIEQPTLSQNSTVFPNDLRVSPAIDSIGTLTLGFTLTLDGLESKSEIPGIQLYVDTLLAVNDLEVAGSVEQPTLS